MLVPFSAVGSLSIGRLVDCHTLASLEKMERSSANAVVSQEYFDEVCLENQEDFDMSEEEAVQETIQQLESSMGGDKKLPPHLILSFPASEMGKVDRRINQDLQKHIQVLQSCTTATVEEAGDQQASLQEALQGISKGVKDIGDQGVARFVVCGGFDASMDLWQQTPSGRDETVYDLLLATFMTEQLSRRQGSKTVMSLADLQRPCMRLWPTWLATLEEDVSGKLAEWNLTRLNKLLQLAYFGVRHSEANKRAFMLTKSSDLYKSSSASLLEVLGTLSSNEANDVEFDRMVGGPLCRLIATLCTFDDFRVTEGAPTVASAHTNVQTFHQENGVIRLARYLQEKKEASAILALRALAINDEIVQTMVAVGLLETASALLQSLLSADSVEKEESPLESLTAVVGLFRNVCANDEIKSTLCLGAKSIVPQLTLAMETFPEAALLQEHACATMGAMALRSPKNAGFLVRQNEVTIWIVRAMRKHPNRTTMQRQGALALRNLVSRSEELRPIVLNAGAGEALRDIAARHASCQDEVYAALRDLGLPASMLRVEQDAEGQYVMKKTEMFGERNNSFRPVFD